ncbi:MAG: hypothetical protein ABIP35_13740 [Ginsengibacter sp.]
MMKPFKKFAFFFMLGMFVFVQKNNAQNDSLFRFLKELNYPISSFTVGNLGELYIINTNNQLKKYNENGDSVGVFNQVTKYGKLSYVEAQNPWKVILFYEGFSTIVLLDKYLQVLGNINLRNKNIFRVKAVTTSYDNNIWLFDEQDNKLKKIDDAGNLLSESVDFRQLFDSVPSPKEIIDRDGFVYLYDPLKGFYIFDYYGSFKSKLTFLNWKDFSVFGKSMYGFDDENIYKYEAPLPDLQKFKLPAALQKSASIKMTPSKIYALKNKRLGIYSLQ